MLLRKCILWAGLALLAYSALALFAPFGHQLIDLITGNEKSNDPQGSMFDGLVILFGTLPLGALLTVIGFVMMMVNRQKRLRQEPHDA